MEFMSEKKETLNKNNITTTVIQHHGIVVGEARGKDAVDLLKVGCPN